MSEAHRTAPEEIEEGQRALTAAVWGISGGGGWDRWTYDNIDRPSGGSPKLD